MMSQASNPIGVIGTGTMGAGIAQTAAAAGWKVKLFDTNTDSVQQAILSVGKRFERLVEKERITEEQADVCKSNLIAVNALEDLHDCDLIIEAIVEDFDIKTSVLKQLGSIASDAVLATNTSSLSVSELGDACGHAERVVGLHFFNPAPIMPLVEVVKGSGSTEQSVQRAALLAEAWGKKVVQASDTPGFIVNRVARPYYLESWRIVEDGYATVSEVDEALQLLGEFRMGPFMLTDLIGQDINVATTNSVWGRLDQPSRLAPSSLQSSLVENNYLGKKTGRGAYAHDGDGNATPAIIQETHELATSDALTTAINAFCLEATRTSGSAIAKYIFSRVLISIINEALWAKSEGVASEQDIDTAMKLGTNYPKGPFEWIELVGMDKVLTLLEELNNTVDDDRFLAPSTATCATP